MVVLHLLGVVLILFMAVCMSEFILVLFVVDFSLFAVGCVFAFSNRMCDVCVNG